MFAAVVDKAKILEEVKCIERERKDQKRTQSNMKKYYGPSGSIQRPKERARVDGLSRNEVSITSNMIPRCTDCVRRHLSECWRKSGACLCCGPMEHRV